MEAVFVRVDVRDLWCRFQEFVAQLSEWRFDVPRLRDLWQSLGRHPDDASTGVSDGRRGCERWGCERWGRTGPRNPGLTPSPRGPLTHSYVGVGEDGGWMKDLPLCDSTPGSTLVVVSHSGSRVTLSFGAPSGRGPCATGDPPVPQDTRPSLPLG